MMYINSGMDIIEFVQNLLQNLSPSSENLPICDSHRKTIEAGRSVPIPLPDFVVFLTYLHTSLEDNRGEVLSMALPAGLSLDAVEEILRRVDGTTLARAGCVCNEFGRIARDDALWEDVCRSLCPSTAQEPRLHCFISSSFGGFRKFYAHAFPFILHRFYDDSPHNSNVSASPSPFPCLSPSDLVSIVDLQYKHKSIYSQVLWGIPDADDLHGWFSNCPFRIDLLSFSCDEEEEAESSVDSSAGQPSFWVSCAERVGASERFWREEVMENLRLRWIIMNRRTNRAVNVSSWRPLGGQRLYSDRNHGFVIRFGSILPSAGHSSSSGKAVQCILVMKCSLCCDEGESGKLKINELSLQLRDMAGGHVDGKNSLLVLERAMECRRTTDHNEVLECYHQYLKAQFDLNEQKARRDGRFETLLILTGIAAFSAFWYLVLAGKSVCVF